MRRQRYHPYVNFQCSIHAQSPELARRGLKRFTTGRCSLECDVDREEIHVRPEVFSLSFHVAQRVQGDGESLVEYFLEHLIYDSFILHLHRLCGRSSRFAADRRTVPEKNQDKNSE